MLICNLSALENGVAIGTLISDGADTGKTSKVVNSSHVQLHFLSVGKPSSAVVNSALESSLLAR